MLSDEEVDKLINALERQRGYCDALYCKPITRKIVRDWFEAAQQSVQADGRAYRFCKHGALYGGCVMDDCPNNHSVRR